MTNKRPPSSSSVPTYHLPLHHSCLHSIGLTTKTLIQPAHTRNLSFLFTRSLLQFSTPSLQLEAGPFQTAGRVPAVLWEVLWSRELSQGGSALTRADRAADLIFSSFTAFLEFSSKTSWPARHGKPRCKCDSLCP